jgi:uncharacterized protein (TIGR00661 family)
MSRLSVAFVVQGEGRGHMTQALALARFLREAGHEVSRVLVGVSPFRSVPEYFTNEIGAPVETFAAPTQVPDRLARGVSYARTAADAVARLPRFLGAGRRIHEVTESADVVVNFLDLVAGLARVVFRGRAPRVAIAHNYVFLHPSLAGAPGGELARRSVLAYAKLTASGAHTKAALSFGPLPAHPSERLVVTPPLLRPEIEGLGPHDGGYLLTYALNPGYGELVAAWQSRHPEVTVHCYVDGGRDALGTTPSDGFHAHSLSADAFLRHLEGCRAYVGTAGFESVCEAFWLGKPALLVPTAGQHEQTLNAWDAARAGAAVVGTYADLDGFWAEPPVPRREAVDGFRNWVRRAPEMLVDVVEKAARSRRAAR